MKNKEPRWKKIPSTITDEMRQYIIENAPNLHNEELTKRFNKKFGTQYKMEYLKKVKCKLGVKGLGMDWQKGKIAPNAVAVGTERISKCRNFIEIKVKESKSAGNYNDCWERKHRYLYKKYYGEIPKNCIVIFLNRNKRDFSKKNLVAVDKDAFRVATRQGWVNNEICNPELTKLGIMTAQLYIQMGKIKKED